MRELPPVLLAALVVACSTPFPPPAPVAAAPVPAAPAPQRPSLPQIVPLEAQPGFRLCSDCAPATPTPKTVAGAPEGARVASSPTRSAAPAPVTVRYATSIPFAFGSFALDRNGRAELEAFIARLPRGLAPSLVSVAGRTDSVGPREANARIARARAQTVLAALRTRLHPQSEDISAEPLCCYIAANATAAGRADNRRVDVVAIVEIQ